MLSQVELCLWILSDELHGYQNNRDQQKGDDQAARSKALSEIFRRKRVHFLSCPILSGASIVSVASLSIFHL